MLSLLSSVIVPASSARDSVALLCSVSERFINVVCLKGHVLEM